MLVFNFKKMDGMLLFCAQALSLLLFMIICCVVQQGLTHM